MDTVRPRGRPKDTADRWFHTLYEGSGYGGRGRRARGVRADTGPQIQIQAPGSFSVRTLRAVGAMTRLTARHFRRAASVSIRLTPDGMHIMDARIPAVGGALGANCLQKDGLPYSVLTDLTENGLLHPDYNSYHPYGPLDLPVDAGQRLGPVQIPFAHQDAMWVLVPNGDAEKAKSIRVNGAQLTSCGVELLGVADIEPLPDFTRKLADHFAQAGYRMVRSR